MENWKSMEKLSAMKVLLDIAGADGIANRNESIYISDISKTFRITDEEILMANRIPVIQALTNLSLMPEDRKLSMANMMRRLIEVDGEIHPNEIVIMKAAFHYMGFEILD